MKSYLPAEEYRSLLTLDAGSPLWTWHHGVVDPGALSVLARRIPDLVGYTFQDDKARPLTLFLSRLLFELGVFTHRPTKQVGKQAGATEDPDPLHDWLVRPEFLGKDGLVRLLFSFATPWGIQEITAGAVNDFLAQAVAVGDGTPNQITHTNGGSPIGLRIDRAIDLLWDEAGAGRLAMSPPDGITDELIFAFDLGAELRLVNCGRPRFTSINEAELAANGWLEIKAPTPSLGFPRTFAFQDPLSSREERFFLPGTEGGGQFRLSGAAFVAGGEDHYPVSGTLGDDGPVIRAHFEYVPGWFAGSLGTRREWAWNHLSEDSQADIVSRFSLVREL